MSNLVRLPPRRRAMLCLPARLWEWGPSGTSRSAQRPKKAVTFFFPYNPPPPQPRQTARPTPKSLISVHFGSVWLRFGSIWLRLAPFRLRFGSVSGPFRGVGWGRGGFGERGFCKGKEYHYRRKQWILSKCHPPEFITNEFLPRTYFL